MPSIQKVVIERAEGLTGHFHTMDSAPSPLEQPFEDAAFSGPQG